MESLTIGPRTFVWGERTYLMGVINVSPDSFLGGHFAGHFEGHSLLGLC